MLCPGGFDHAGGIGRWAGYLFAEWRNVADAPPLVMLDTRGFGGWFVAAAAFARSLAGIVRMRASGELGLLHINLSVRGSAVRKSIVSDLAWLLRVPTIVHLHSGRFPEFFHGLPGWARRRVLRIFDRAARVIVLGSVWEGILVSELDVLRAKIVVLPNAVPAPLPAPPRPAAGPCHIVMLGRLGVPKGTPELLRALAGGTMAGGDWRATLAGDGEVETYRREVAALGLAEKVAIPGWLDSGAVAALMRTADVLVLPSHSENLPVAVVEALSYGVPVVSTPVGATPELVEDGVSALLVPVRDPDALAAAMARLVADPALRAEIGRNGQAVFRDRLDIRKAAEQLAALYRELMSPPRLG